MIKWRKYFSFTNQENKKILWWFSGAIFFLGLFIKITAELENGKLQTLDQNILLFIGNHLRSPALNGAAVDITAMGSPSLIGIVSIISIMILIIIKDRIGLYYYLISTIGATIWVNLIKAFVARPRPQVITHLVEVSGQSYPSGHSLVVTAAYFSIAIIVSRHIQTVAVMSITFITATLLVLLTAFSRLYLGVHYPSDVCSGILFGISWVLFLTAVFKSFNPRIKFNS